MPKPTGWRKEPYRHGLAAKHIRTRQERPKTKAVDAAGMDAKNHCFSFSNEDLKNDNTASELVEKLVAWIGKQKSSGRVIYRGYLATDWGHPIYCAVPKGTSREAVGRGMNLHKTKVGLEDYSILHLRMV